MKKTLFLISAIVISSLSFSQKIALTQFTATEWEQVYENENVILFYKTEINKPEVTDLKSFVLFKIINKLSTKLELNISATVEYQNLDESITKSKVIIIEPYGIIEGNSSEDKIIRDESVRIPLEKDRDPENTLKLLKIDF
jgi:hypothetical protein